MSKEISLDLLSESLERVGKREMAKENLEEFVKSVLQHETEMLKKRTKMYSEGEIAENEINTYPFFNDGYHFGVFIHLKDENIYSLGKDDNGEDLAIKQLPKKKNNEVVRDEDGNIVYTDRCYMRLKTRIGGMSVFLGINKAESLEDDKHFVLVGGMSESYAVANSTEFHKQKEDGVEYSRTYYTLNCWQIAKVEKKGKGINIKTDYECNWSD